jgi:hypothetical protein
MAEYDEIYAHAQRGAKKLDHVEPNWHKMIDWDKFNIANPSKCVLGQVFHDYYDGLEKVLPGVPCYSDSQDKLALEYGYNTAVNTDAARQWFKTAWKALAFERQYPSPTPTFTDDERVLLKHLLSEQEDKLTAVWNGEVGAVLEGVFKEQRELLHSIGQKLEA